MAAVRDSDGEKSSFRWLNAVRYVVAAAVFVLIVAVAANAIKVVLRPDTILFSVPGSSVFTRRFPRSRVEGDKLLFSFTVRALNPSGRARMYYYNITAYFFDNTTTPATESRSPSDDCLILFELGDMNVAPMQYEDTTKVLNTTRDPDHITTSFFDKLNKPAAARINDVVTMRVDGTLVTESISGFNTTPKLTTYYCRQLVVGLNPEDQASLSSQATRCTIS
ncbi:hypothetical protein PVAP13_6KG166824 [Panicum virgatum]|jgi:hypothetical protein|uniref:Late embryogenesis abundant protein LEA-2 subgroup domain-containing protein n=1 Tax=Panicum virgatum TaxID=38727 RepID=A0A8T0REM7_PANVG|nr:hypothetical protein PVAP13_6KG166824 [Panicum virgatum]